MSYKTDTLSSGPLEQVYSRLFSEELKKADRRKLAILEASLTLLAQEGVEGVNYERVGKAVGMLRAHVQYYFPSKEALLIDLFKLMTEAGQVATIEKIQEAGEDPIARVEAILEGAYAWAMDRPNDIRAQIHLLALATHHEKFRRLHESIRMAGAKRLETLIVESGLKLRKGITPLDAAFSTHAAIIGTLWMAFSLDGIPSLPRMKEFARAQIFSNFEASSAGENTSLRGKGENREAAANRQSKKRKKN